MLFDERFHNGAELELAYDRLNSDHLLVAKEGLANDQQTKEAFPPGSTRSIPMPTAV